MSTVTTNADTTIATASKIHPEQVVAFAALILADDNIEVTPEKLQTLLNAAAITEVESIWTTLFANALKDKDVKDLLTAVTTSGFKAGSGDPLPQTDSNGVEDSDEGIDLCGDRDSDEDNDDMFGGGLFD